MNHTTRLVLVSGTLLLGVLASITPTATAQDASDWSTPVGIDTDGDTADNFALDAIGEKVGFAFQLDTANTIGFALKEDQDTNWVLKSSDIDGVGTNIAPTSLASLGGDRWAMLTNGGAATGCNVYYSSDDGSTWTLQVNIAAADCDTAVGDEQRIRWAGGDTLYVLHRDGSNTMFRRSEDLGLTWARTRIVNDNQGGAGTPTQSGCCGSKFDMTLRDAPETPDTSDHQIVIYMNSGTNIVYTALSTDGGDLFSVPYTQNGGSTLDTSKTIACSPFTSAEAITLNGPQRVGTIGFGSEHTTFIPVQRSTPTKVYGCVDRLYEFPSDNPTTSLSILPDNHPAADCNPDAQCLYAMQETSGVNGYVYYRGPGGSTLSLSTTASIQSGGRYQIEMTDTRGYFVYVDSTSGALMETHADAFAPAISSGQVAVNDLVGYSMDDSGANIVVRTDNGLTVETYGVGDLAGGSISTASTPDCNADGPQMDGVAIERFNDGDSVETFVVYVDCEGDGDSDAFRIRSTDLTQPVYGCNDATTNVEDGDVVIPENLGEIGLISDLNPTYANGRCSDENAVDFAAIGFSFSTVGTAAQGGGKIGTVSIVYNDPGNDLTDTDVEVLDSNPFPQIEQFCGWTNRFTGRDFIGGVASQGATKVFEVESSITATGLLGGHEPDVDLVPMFSNSGQYGNAVGLGCAKDSIVIQQENEVHWLNNVAGTETVQSGWPIVLVDPVANRGVAMSGNANFTAVLDGSSILIYAKNGTQTAELAVPSGTWRGMEFDYSAEHLAVFTNDFITVYETASATCELDDSCASDSAIGADDPDAILNPDDSDDETECNGAILCTDSTNVPAGFTVGTFNAFLGVLLISGISAGGYYTLGKSPIVAGGFAIVGLILANILGLIPLWVILVLVILGVATIFLAKRGG